MPHAMVTWAAWGAFFAWAAAEALRLGGPKARSAGGRRIAWTAGCAALWVHAALAMHLHHQWSHEAALRATAEDTYRVLKLDWGGGIYFNYLLLAVWGADAAWWWIDARRYDGRPPVVTLVVHGYLAFMFVQGAVVFSESHFRWLALAALAGLAALALQCARRSGGRDATAHPRQPTTRGGNSTGR